MSNSPLIVYLDSSDYSSLSNPRLLTEETQRIRNKLIDYVQSGQVKFVYSAAHISEMSPLEESYATAAIDRADLLVKLCGNNALISFDRLIEQEIRALCGPASFHVDALTSNGTWFPTGTRQVFNPDSLREMCMYMDGRLKEDGQNRAARRKIKRQLYKKNTPTPMMQDLMEVRLRDWVTTLGMRPKDSIVLFRFFQGLASSEQANEAFLNSLRDPAWMMVWFSDHHKDALPLIDWVRSPAKELTATLRQLTSRMNDIYQEASPEIKKFLMQNSRAEFQLGQEKCLMGLARSFADILKLQLPQDLTIESIDSKCPGLSTGVRTFYSSTKASIGQTPRPPEESDYADFIHSMYAPYVNILRADRYMSPHIKPHASKFGTTVVSRLVELEDQISKHLSH